MHESRKPRYRNITSKGLRNITLRHCIADSIPKQCKLKIKETCSFLELEKLRFCKKDRTSSQVNL